MTDTSTTGAPSHSWADKTAPQILADVDTMLAAIRPFANRLVVSTKALRTFNRLVRHLERRSMSRRAYFRLRGRRKALRRAD